MKNVQIVFNIQIPDHVSEPQISTRLKQAISSLMTQEFGMEEGPKELTALPFDEQDGQIGHA